jgi:hypothetical protein
LSDFKNSSKQISCCSYSGDICNGEFMNLWKVNNVVEFFLSRKDLPSSFAQLIVSILIGKVDSALQKSSYKSKQWLIPFCKSISNPISSVKAGGGF